MGITRPLLASAVWPVAAAAGLVLGTPGIGARAAEPCGDFGECRALIEINASDGDIGFHFLMDGEDLRSARIADPDGSRVFDASARGSLEEQKLTEISAESAEPLCRPDPEDPGAEVVTLEEFVERWPAGPYLFSGRGDGERPEGETALSHAFPAAPADLAFDGQVISWAAGTDLGRCASMAELDALVAEGVLPIHPADVPVVAWEIALEPDVADGDPTGRLVFQVRVAGDIAVREVGVPAEYLAALPDDTPVKIEVGAVGAADNATFSELGDLCVNEVAGCP
jgi:hypothetical protein